MEIQYESYDSVKQDQENQNKTAQQEKYKVKTKHPEFQNKKRREIKEWSDRANTKIAIITAIKTKMFLTSFLKSTI